MACYKTVAGPDGRASATSYVGCLALVAAASSDNASCSVNDTILQLRQCYCRCRRHTTPDVSCVGGRSIINIGVGADSIGETGPERQIFTNALRAAPGKRKQRKHYRSWWRVSSERERSQAIDGSKQLGGIEQPATDVVNNRHDVVTGVPTDTPPKTWNTSKLRPDDIILTFGA